MSRTAARSPMPRTCMRVLTASIGKVAITTIDPARLPQSPLRQGSPAMASFALPLLRGMNSRPVGAQAASLSLVSWRTPPAGHPPEPLRQDTTPHTKTAKP
eukprot:CAMPEP_0118988946 /NCGR_PEP_ID=MMETSP1173-20130426/47103_1 /TAXON_ID=1034831 /ORGANISM="Rhizochromulina marina cf, Strain CCMP1243" /LENGTH=100 /DNA_ID=CAMNT_0006939905 /DNA_START=791 /DNA_END=1093 /DNA_ORIENTATION=+